jgi:hypothetical protein
MWGENMWDAYGLKAIEMLDFLSWVKDTELALRILRERDPLLHACIFSPHEADDYHASLWGASLILSSWLVGNIEIAVVETDSEPPSDSLLARFSPKLPYPFEVELWGGIADFDGSIEWKEPIPFMNSHGDFRTHKPREYVPVEVGECHPMKMWFFLVQCAYIARYPYGWNRIVIFHLKNWDKVIEGMLKAM